MLARAGMVGTVGYSGVGTGILLISEEVYAGQGFSIFWKR